MWYEGQARLVLYILPFQRAEVCTCKNMYSHPVHAVLVNLLYPRDMCMHARAYMPLLWPQVSKEAPKPFQTAICYTQ